MANFALVEQGEITTVVDKLPSSWRNVSGLDLSSTDLPLLATLGWLPVIPMHTPFDPNYEHMNGYTYEIHDNAVHEFSVIELNPPSPLYSIEFLHTAFMDQLRAERNQRLTASDWTQTADLQAIKAEEWRNNWAIYRQSLRDLPAQYDELSIYDMVLVIWPEPPHTQG
jgi:hypothetical protein